MRKLRMTIEVVYDDEIMHSNCPEAIDWFYEQLLGKDNVWVHINGDLNDTLGVARVLKIQGGP